MEDSYYPLGEFIIVLLRILLFDTLKGLALFDLLTSLPFSGNTDDFLE